MNLSLVFLLLVTGVLIILIKSFFSACKKANKTDWGSPLLNILEGLNRIFCHRYHRLNEVTIPLNASGAAIVVSNHVSGLDPMLLIASTPRPLRFLIAREQYERFGFKWLFKAVGCIPIDRSKKADNSMKLAIRALTGGEVLAIFPHGKIHLPGDAAAKLKPGATRLAKKINCSVFPARISGVRAQGHVLTPVLLRASAQLEVCKEIKVEEMDVEEINAMISSCIDEVVF